MNTYSSKILSKFLYSSTVIIIIDIEEEKDEMAFLEKTSLEIRIMIIIQTHYD